MGAHEGRVSMQPSPPHSFFPTSLQTSFNELSKSRKREPSMQFITQPFKLNITSTFLQSNKVTKFHPSTIHLHIHHGTHMAKEKGTKRRYGPNEPVDFEDMSNW